MGVGIIFSVLFQVKMIQIHDRPSPPACGGPVSKGLIEDLLCKLSRELIFASAGLSKSFEYRGDLLLR